MGRRPEATGVEAIGVVGYMCVAKRLGAERPGALRNSSVSLAGQQGSEKQSCLLNC